MIVFRQDLEITGLTDPNSTRCTIGSMTSECTACKSPLDNIFIGHGEATQVCLAAWYWSWNIRHHDCYHCVVSSTPRLHSNLNAWKLSKLALLIANLPASSDENTSYQITDNVLVQLSNPENIQYSVWVSYLELYNENVYDLLQPPPEQGLLYFEYFTIDIWHV